MSSSHLCIECGNDFKSTKALHGHLRCHPERNYRGINPTSRRNLVRQKRKDMGSAAATSGTIPALMEPIYVEPLSWCPPDQLPPPPPLKKMRSKTHNRRFPSDARSTYNPSIIPAASYSSLSALREAFQVNPPPQPHTSHDVLPLPAAACIGRHLGKLYPNSLSQATDSQSDELGTNSATAGMEEHSLQIDSHPADQTVVSNAQNLSQEANLKRRTNSSSTTRSLFIVKGSFQNGLKKKSKREVDGQNQFHSKSAFSCNICSKSFDLYQILGSHMMIHLEKSKAIRSGSGKVAGHPCNICGEIYPTGQALGGHKRKHWVAPQPVTQPQPEPQPQPDNILPGFKLFGVWIPV